MFWVQAFACFAIWIGYGIWQSRRRDAVAARVASVPRNRRAISGVAWMLIGATSLFLALMSIHAMGGFSSQGMSPLAMAMILAAGLFFVHSQTMAMAILVTIVADGVVTSDGSATSHHQNSPNQP